MIPEWTDRVNHWIRTLEKEFYEPIASIPFAYFTTYEMLDEETAEKGPFSPAPVGTEWGRIWEYGWFRGDIVTDSRAAGKPLVLDIRTGGEATVFVNGEAFGTRRAEWVKVPHHYLCDQLITTCAESGQRFHIVLEAYAGHDYPDNAGGWCATGPVRPEDLPVTDPEKKRQKVQESTYGIWHEEAYQLWLDATVLRDLLKVCDPDSLRASRIEEALEAMTKIADFEQPRQERLQSYIAAREVLRPVLEAQNGDTMPEMWAVGNSHLDLSWLWPFRETQRKVARTFAQQVRLMDLYPDYRYIQSQPESYLICKQLYPKLYEKIKEKIKAGQWIADGSMWVEPDTNMTGGEAMIRQLMYGKRFYKEEFGKDTELLWLPDTFGYSGNLPQILKGCGVRYMTTQKIFWSYNGGERFPYHYFTWKGIDGTGITAFLHMDYTSDLNANTVSDRWKNRVQKRDLSRFLMPFGYGDGGGGPTRDHIENALREKNLEGIPKVKMDAPDTFFKTCLAEGDPKNSYTGELYFPCHRGTYTSQAATKLGNRRSEILMREAEMWSTFADLNPAETLRETEEAWKKILLNQFHDILPGSSIGRVYEEAAKRYGEVRETAESILGRALSTLTEGENGTTYFNSLSWNREHLVKGENGYCRVRIPACGWTSIADSTVPENPVRLRILEDGSAEMQNSFLKIVINPLGEITLCEDASGFSRISGNANVLRMYKDVPRFFDAWDIDSVALEDEVSLEADGCLTVLENTPWKCTVRIERSISHSKWGQNISLWYNKSRIDFETDVDWHEQHKLLKAAFPTGIHAEEGLNEIQFGYIRRPTHRSRPYDKDRFEVCNHRYTALCESNRGAAVLNDCKYGVSMLGDEIALSLLRAPTTPDPNADRGHNHFTYAYYVWNGPFYESNVVREGYEMNVPVFCAEGKKETGSMFALNQESIILETVKQAEDGSGDWIVRLYESKESACTATLSCGFSFDAAYECDMLENKQQPITVDEKGLTLAFRPFEIKTLRIVRSGR